MRSLDGPDTRYMMLWCGEWRPVTNMLDHSGRETTLASRATGAVLYLSEHDWVPTQITQGDLIERTDRDPDKRKWEFID